MIVIVLTKNDRDTSLQKHVAKFLRNEGINFYIPGAHDINTMKNWQNATPNIFWKNDAVTVSRIHQAKGNEADVVYVVGFDGIAQDENNINLRNQLFVALTRSRGWAKLSGIGDYPMYSEMRTPVIP
jgi:superfamily I DNA and RNA helicase